jgi:hypothetical protein
VVEKFKPPPDSGFDFTSPGRGARTTGILHRQEEAGTGDIIGHASIPVLTILAAQFWIVTAMERLMIPSRIVQLQLQNLRTLSLRKFSLASQTSSVPFWALLMYDLHIGSRMATSMRKLIQVVFLSGDGVFTNLD